MKATWSKQYDYSHYTQASFEEWQKSIQQRDIDLTSALDAGSWNSVEIILAPATAEQLDTVTLSMTANTVQLTIK